MASPVEVARAGRLATALEREEAMDFRDEDGWTPLTWAAADGRSDLVQVLVGKSANVNFPNQWGETALSRAVFGGHVDVVRLLLDKGAAINLSDEDGDTPLHVAVIRKQVELARLLLKRNADVEVTNKDGMTALALAHHYGLRDLVELLQAYQGGQRGAGSIWRTARGIGGWVYQFVGVSATSEPEEEASAGAIGNELVSSVRHSSNHNYSQDDTRSQDNRGHDDDVVAGDHVQKSRNDSKNTLPRDIDSEQSVTSLLPVLLELCASMVETQDICEDVLERLERAQYRIDEQETATTFQTKRSLQQITSHFHCFLLQHVKQASVERLASTRTIVGLLEGFHYDIDKLVTQGLSGESVSILTNWKERWDDGVIAVEKRLVALWEANWPELSKELPDTESQTGALLLLNCETTRHKARYSARSRDLLESVAKKVARMSGAAIPEIPPWFVPRHEVQRDTKPFASGAFGKVYRGVWQGSKVVIKCVKVTSAADKKTFRREATIWHRLRHPHIVNFFGACHQSHPCFFICEEAANGNLVDYLEKVTASGRRLIWRKLHEAALGLQFLHQNDIVHGDLKCNQILVGGDGKARLTDFGFSFISSESNPTDSGGATRWRAPECLDSNYQTPTFESDVYSFGMCVVEAVTYNVPWGIYLPDRAVIDHLQHRKFLPRPQQFEKDKEWEFVLDLCAFEPSKRLKLLDAIERLNKFANELPMDDELSQTAPTDDLGVQQKYRLSKKISLDLLKEARIEQLCDAGRKVTHSIIGFSARSRYLRFRHAVRTIQLIFRYKKQPKNLQLQEASKLQKMGADYKIFGFLRMVHDRKNFLRFLRVVRVLQCRFRFRCLLRAKTTELTPVQNSKNRRRTIFFADTHSVLGLSQTVISVDDSEPLSQQTRSQNSALWNSRVRHPSSPQLSPEPYNPPWVNDEDRFNCYICTKEFTMFRRKHHCRVCFEIVCSNCSLTRKKMRACMVCAGLRSAADVQSVTGSKTQTHPRRRGGIWQNLAIIRKSRRNALREEYFRSGEDGNDVALSSGSIELSSEGQNGLWNDDGITAARIPRDAVIIKSKISRGAFGEVHLGTWNGMKVAVKTLLPESRKYMVEINQFLGEAKIMASMEHPCIVNLVGVAWNSLADVCMVVEYMDGGDLRSLLDQYQAAQCAVGFNTVKAKIALNVCHALTYLHSLSTPLIHRDLKSRNILLNRALEAKVTDFGISRERGVYTMTAGVGTSLWMAPEVIMGERYDEKADIFSFGVVLSELDVHSLPYANERTGRPPLRVIQKVLAGSLRVEFSESLPSSVAELGIACVSLDPQERPTAAEALYRIQLFC